MTKLKLKKKAKSLLFISIILVLFISIGLYSGIKIHKQKEYEKTYEYKLTTLGYSLENTKEAVERLDKLLS